MKKILAGSLVTLIAVPIVAYGIGWTGTLSFAADEPHADLVKNAIGWFRERAIDNASTDIAIPSNLADAERIRRGAGNYAAMCADCHLRPGQGDSEIRKGLYPVPPDLAGMATDNDPVRTDARKFWIIKHGIKGSGMAAWSKGGMDDESIWDLVAFLRQLPQLQASAYTELVADSDGHMHGGLEHDDQHDAEHTHASAESATAAETQGHKPGAHDHSHAGHAH